MSKKFFDIAEQLKSLAHPDRIAIVKLIGDCRDKHLTVKNIYERMKMEQPIVSRHLSILRRSGILKREQENNNTYYFLNEENKMTNQLVKMF